MDSVPVHFIKGDGVSPSPFFESVLPTLVFAFRNAAESDFLRQHTAVAVQALSRADPIKV
jgi:hypothetical protein